MDFFEVGPMERTMEKPQRCCLWPWSLGDVPLIKVEEHPFSICTLAFPPPSTSSPSFSGPLTYHLLPLLLSWTRGCAVLTEAKKTRPQPCFFLYLFLFPLLFSDSASRNQLFESTHNTPRNLLGAPTETSLRTTERLNGWVWAGQ